VNHRAALGVAIITRDVLQSVLAEIEDAQYQGPPALSLRRVQESLKPRQAASATSGMIDRLAPQAECPACLHAREMEDVYLGTLLAHLSGAEGLQADLEASDGLCLPHFRRTLALVREETVFLALVSVQASIWRRLIGQLGEFIRKQDHRFSDELWGEEANSWRRAVTTLAGNRPD
jgi:hypothetical protein